ncbi:MAG: restriction endonuclease subunit [Gammaproteobacteria bacterium]|jgi:type I restriction enzyme R subunit|nr:restriction endonuclease subunit [Gammaproteobacteria bacterium]
MNKKEATARIKINKLLEMAGWRFFPEGNKPANIQLEPSVMVRSNDLDALGNNFEKVSRGFIDFLLLNEKGFPFIVLEAKSEDKNPLSGKEQARQYAKSLNCRFVILSNGNLHYFWDIERGNPSIITTFPTPSSVMGYQKTVPDPKRLVGEVINDDYIVLTQRPTYASEAGWKNESERQIFIETNKLRFLRPYQKKAIQALQKAVYEGKDRFLFEMATGTGKTLVSAAIIKLFLRTGNAQRVLFLVDRLELEEQAWKAFKKVLANDYQAVIYKENRDDWHRAEIVVSTVQSLLFNNKYQHLFSPTDFDLVISDEAHRSIGGNARSVFDYFIGYKLGLTATPRDYLNRWEGSNASRQDPREYERRLLLDTYRTFGCSNGQPTFRYSLLDGVRDGYLINPTVVDARSDITTQLLSEKGFVVEFKDDEGENQTETYRHRQFEKNFFSEATNQLFCKIFLENALRDPVSGEIGKSIIFAVSQNHAAKLTQILNQMADVMYPGKYQSDFAVQVTSQISDAQQFTINFTNNNLCGSENFLPGYKTSKARICVTVGMMTTGYDCPDLLNLGLFRPIFSPTDFIQIKGRGTRKHSFLEELFNEDMQTSAKDPNKTTYKLIDFFANYDYFEKEFNYDEVISLPRQTHQALEVSDNDTNDSQMMGAKTYEHTGPDIMATIRVEPVGDEGMRIDRMFFNKFENAMRENSMIVEAVEHGQWDRVIDYINREIFDKPNDYYSLDKLRKAAAVDRRISLREILEKIFGLIPRFKSKEEMLEEEFAKFIADYKPQEAEAIPALKNYFKAYAISPEVRHIIETNHYTELATNPILSIGDFKAVPEYYRTLIPEYIKNYVSLNQFAP